MREQQLLFQSWLPQWQVSAVLVMLAYLATVRALRFQRMNQLQKKYSSSRQGLARMTMDDASAVQRELVELEFPFVYQKALEFALFKTYGIPTISSLLVTTKQLIDPVTVPKRYVDTTVLIREFAGNPPGSDRYLSAIARMNYIHSVYQKAGKISNADLLYTLSLFALEPIRWIAKYEWRDLTSMEKIAIGTFWKKIGDDMGIDYGELGGIQGGWRDGLEWLDMVREWSEKFEEKMMVPHNDNRTTADRTTDLLLWALPQSLHPLGYHVISVLMEDRLRTAMMYEKPPRAYFVVVNALLYLRKLVIRHVMLPRPSFMRVRNISDTKNVYGRYYLKFYDNAPVYIQPSLWMRLSPQAWMFWLLGRPIPGDEKHRFHSEGYDIEDVGPNSMLGKGMDEMKDTKTRLAQQDYTACPFRL